MVSRSTPSLASLCVATLVTGLSAQATFTSPPYAEQLDGSRYTRIFAPLASPNLRLQCIVDDVRGTPRLIRGVDLRPDGLDPLAEAGAVDIEVLLAHASFAALSSTFANNYAAAPTTVITRRTFTVRRPVYVPGSPQPWSVAMPFDSATAFAYDGRQDLLVEFRSFTSTVPNYALDAEGTFPFGGAGGGRYLGGTSGCGGAQQIIDGILGYDEPRLLLRTRATGLGANAPAALLIGLSDPDTDFGGLLCTRLRAMPDILVPVTADANGEVGSSARPLQVPFVHPRLVMSFYSQFIAARAPAAPLVLTNGVEWGTSSIPRPAGQRTMVGGSGPAADGAIVPYSLVLRFRQ